MAGFNHARTFNRPVSDLSLACAPFLALTDVNIDFSAYINAELAEIIGTAQNELALRSENLSEEERIYHKANQLM